MANLVRMEQLKQQRSFKPETVISKIKNIIIHTQNLQEVHNTNKICKGLVCLWKTIIQKEVSIVNKENGTGFTSSVQN